MLILNEMKGAPLELSWLSGHTCQSCSYADKPRVHRSRCTPPCQASRATPAGSRLTAMRLAVATKSYPARRSYVLWRTALQSCMVACSALARGHAGAWAAHVHAPAAAAHDESGTGTGTKRGTGSSPTGHGACTSTGALTPPLALGATRTRRRPAPRPCWERPAHEQSIFLVLVLVRKIIACQHIVIFTRFCKTASSLEPPSFKITGVQIRSSSFSDARSQASSFCSFAGEACHARMPPSTLCLASSSAEYLGGAKAGARALKGGARLRIPTQTTCWPCRCSPPPARSGAMSLCTLSHAATCE